MKYRICENEYGYFKIQRFVKRKFLCFKQEKWEYTAFNKNNEIMTFDTIEKAEKVVKKFIKEDMMNSENWVSFHDVFISQKSICAEKSKKHSKYWNDRFTYYKNHPEDLDSKYDDHVLIRELYYKSNPHDIDYKNDSNKYIREELNLPLKNNNEMVSYGVDKYSKNPYIRKSYYENYPNDKDAKKDKDLEIRKIYYENYPEDKDG